MIATLESVNGRALRNAKSPLDYLIKTSWTAVDLPPWKDIEAGRTRGKVKARVNHGRWVVDCPTDGCTGAVLASETDRRFVCVDCAAGPYEVVWPKERDGIEEALNARPQPNRNWTPGESVGDLRSENKRHLHDDKADKPGRGRG